eukprot:1759390-Ditylum_brightwellii.AAC.1
MSGIRWADSSSDEESDEETFEIGTEEHEITTLQDFSEPAVTQVSVCVQGEREQRVELLVMSIAMCGSSG